MALTPIGDAIQTVPLDREIDTTRPATEPEAQPVEVQGPEQPQDDAATRIGAAMLQSNTIASIFNSDRLWTGGRVSQDPNFNSVDAVKGTKYERYADRFVNDINEQQVEARKHDIDLEEASRGVLDRFPWYDRLILEGGAAIADVPTLLPGAGVVRSAGAGFSAGRSAVAVGASAGLAGAASEVGLRASQTLRTDLESGVAIGASTILGAGIGYGAARLLTRSQRIASERALANAEREAAALDRRVNGEPEPAPAPRVEPEAAPVAAAADEVIPPVVADPAAPAPAQPFGDYLRSRGAEAIDGPDMPPISRDLNPANGDNARAFVIDRDGRAYDVTRVEGGTGADDVTVGHTAIREDAGQVAAADGSVEISLGAGDNGITIGARVQSGGVTPAQVRRIRDVAKGYEIDPRDLVFRVDEGKIEVITVDGAGRGAALPEGYRRLTQEALAESGALPARAAPEAPRAAEPAPVAEPAAPVVTRAVGDTRDVAVVRDGDTIDLATSAGEARTGRMRLRETDEAVVVEGVGVADEAKGAGNGMRLYEKAWEEATERGKPLVSDSEVNGPAVRMYEGLERRGAVVERNPNVETLPDGTIRSTDGEPVFSVQPREEAPFIRTELDDIRSRGIQPGEAFEDYLSRTLGEMMDDANPRARQPGESADDYVSRTLAELMDDPETGAIAKEVYGGKITQDAADAAAARRDVEAPAGAGRPDAGSGPAGGAEGARPAAEGAGGVGGRDALAAGKPDPKALTPEQARLAEGEFWNAPRAVDEAPRESAIPDEQVRSSGEATSGGAMATPDMTVAPIPREDLGISLKAGMGWLTDKAASASAGFNPNLRQMFSPSAAARRISQMLADNTLYTVMNDAGRSLGANVEILARGEYQRMMAEVTVQTKAIYKEMRASGRNISRQQFDDAIGFAMRRGDQDQNPFVAAAAQAWRKEVFDPLKKRAIELKLLPEDVDVRTADTYFTRQWDVNRLIAREPEFKDTAQTWLRKILNDEFKAAEAKLERGRLDMEREVDDLRVDPGEARTRQANADRELRDLIDANPQHVKALEDYGIAMRERRAGEKALAEAKATKTASVAEVQAKVAATEAAEARIAAAKTAAKDAFGSAPGGRAEAMAFASQRNKLAASVARNRDTQEAAAELARMQSHIDDLQLTPEQRSDVLATLDAQRAALFGGDSPAAAQVKRISELMAERQKLRAEGKDPEADALMDEVARIRTEGGDELKGFRRQLADITERRQRIAGDEIGSREARVKLSDDIAKQREVMVRKVDAIGKKAGGLRAKIDRISRASAEDARVAGRELRQSIRDLRREIDGLGREQFEQDVKLNNMFDNQPAPVPERPRNTIGLEDGYTGRTADEILAGGRFNATFEEGEHLAVRDQFMRDARKAAGLEEAETAARTAKADATAKEAEAARLNDEASRALSYSADPEYVASRRERIAEDLEELEGRLAAMTRRSAGREPLREQIRALEAEDALLRGSGTGEPAVSREAVDAAIAAADDARRVASEAEAAAVDLRTKTEADATARFAAEEKVAREWKPSEPSDAMHRFDARLAREQEIEADRLGRVTDMARRLEEAERVDPASFRTMTPEAVNAIGRLEAEIAAYVTRVTRHVEGQGRRIERLSQRTVDEKLSPRSNAERAAELQADRDLAAAAAKAEAKARAEAARDAFETKEQAFWEKWNIGRDADNGFDRYVKDAVDAIHAKLTGKVIDGDLPDHVVPTSVGPLKERTFGIPDELVEPFLVSNINSVGPRYARKMSGEIELVERFGKATMADQMAEIRADYLGLRDRVTAAATDSDAAAVALYEPGHAAAFKNWVAEKGGLSQLTERERMRMWLSDQEKQSITDIGAMRDMIRGTYNQAAAGSGWGRTVRAANSFNYIRMMGNVVIASMGDIWRPVTIRGLMPYMSEGIGPLLRSLEIRAGLPRVAPGTGFAAVAREAHLAGNAIDRILMARLATMAEIGDPYVRETGIERVLSNGSAIGSRWNGLSLWTDVQKELSSALTMNRMVDGVRNGGDERWMARIGIDKSEYARMLRQLDAHSERVDGITIPRTEHWTDIEAVRTWRAALNRSVDTTIVTKSVGDVPLWTQTTVGKSIFQFKSFMAASHSRMFLAGLQEGPAAFASMMVGMTTLGMLTTYLRALSTNRTDKLSKNPGWWIGEGLDAGGFFTLPFEVNNTIEKAAGINPIKAIPRMLGEAATGEPSPPSFRFESRGIAGALAGPTAGTLLDDLGGLANAAATGKTNNQTVASGARMVPYYSYPGMRQFIDYLVKPALQTPPRR